MPVRIWVALGVLCLGVLGSTLDLRRPEPDPYNIQQQTNRLQGAISQMPRVGTAGYLSDLPIVSDPGSIAFFTAQYAAAPTLLEDETKKQHDWAIGNFSKQLDYAEKGGNVGLSIEKDFGTGVVLYRRAGK